MPHRFAVKAKEDWALGLHKRIAKSDRQILRNSGRPVEFTPIQLNCVDPPARERVGVALVLWHTHIGGHASAAARDTASTRLARDEAATS